MTQINPPYDGSAPCAACQTEVRSLAAYLHNFLTRCSRDGARIEQGKAFVRLVDMREQGLPREIKVPHPAAQEVVDVCRELMQAIAGIEIDGGEIRWSPEIRQRVEALIPRAMKAADVFSPLSEAHFADDRHSRGEPNILRESGGSKWAGFVSPDYEAARYDYTVEVTTEGADLTHEPCGTGLKLHEHFKDKLANDPTFYGKIWCPKCRLNAPSAQFTNRVPRAS